MIVGESMPCPYLEGYQAVIGQPNSEAYSVNIENAIVVLLQDTSMH